MPNSFKESYSELSSLAQDLRDSKKRATVLFAHNGIGKTSLSVAFKDIAKKSGGADTLYYNAFTEDLFYWDNDLDNDEERVLMFRRESHFFDGFNADEMETRIRSCLARYSDFDFNIKLDVKRKDAQNNEQLVNYVTFRRMVYNEESGTTEWKEDIKISRGEENIFKWCFFLSIAQLAIDKAEVYKWVKYIFIDDPISSLDDNNAVVVAHHLASIIKPETNTIHTVITTHHGLFYNVLFNEIQGADKQYLYRVSEKNEDATKQPKYSWKLKDLKDTPFFHHVALVKELNKAVGPDGRLYTYHFNMLRTVLEKTAAFHGYSKFGECIKKFENDPEEQLYSRIINILSHGNYSIYEPIEMNDENKEYFKKVYNDFKSRFPFNVSE